MSAYTQLSNQDRMARATRGEDSAKFHLMSSAQHDGPPEGGAYRVFVHFKANNQWYEVQDLHVNGVHPQLISVSESYIQVRATLCPCSGREPTDVIQCASLPQVYEAARDVAYPGRR